MRLIRPARYLAVACMFIAAATAAPVQAEILPQHIDAALTEVDDEVITWRRDIHRHPELSNREFRTAALVAKHLRALGMEVRTNIAHTGVAAVLRGGKAGPTIALRADMDALPVVERVDVPFRSTATADYLGQQVGVMHACGHDAHVAVLMGVASALASMREDLPGSVQFVFQPAEEGAPGAEEGGAALMLREGLFKETKPAAVFGLHVMAGLRSGVIGYRAGPLMAMADTFRIDVSGRQAHGSRPWSGIDPIVVSSQIVLGLQTIVSRQVDITELPAVVTVGKINGGLRENIVPETVQLAGTIRTFDSEVRDDIIHRMRRTAENIAAAGGAQAILSVNDEPNPAVINDPRLSERVLPSLHAMVGAERVQIAPLQTIAEDFSYYSRFAPSFFFYVGITPDGVHPDAAPSNHSPDFYIDEPALAVAARAMMAVAIGYLQGR